VFLILNVFHCVLPYSRSYPLSFSFSYFVSFFFSPYSRSYSVCVSFFTFLRFLTIFQVLQCVFFFLHDFQCFLPYSRSYHVSFSFSSFVSFFAIFQVKQCLCLIFPCFSVYCHNPGPTVCISHLTHY